METDQDGITRLPELKCPYCGARTNACALADSNDRVAPTDGDYSICFTCAQPCVFVVNSFGVTLRRSTPEEKAKVIRENEDAIKVLIDFNQSRPRPKRTE
jgi:hypothetical protein